MLLFSIVLIVKISFEEKGMVYEKTLNEPSKALLIVATAHKKRAPIQLVAAISVTLWIIWTTHNITSRNFKKK